MIALEFYEKEKKVYTMKHPVFLIHSQLCHTLFNHWDLPTKARVISASWKSAMLLEAGDGKNKLPSFISDINLSGFLMLEKYNYFPFTYFNYSLTQNQDLRFE